MNFVFHFSYIHLIALYLSCASTKQIKKIKLDENKSIINNEFALDSILDKNVQNGSYPFLYARLEKLDGSVIYEHSSVNNDLLPNTMIDAETWIRIWSMSKIVTISVAMDLVEDDIISLNEPVSKYIPEFKNLNSLSISTSLLDVSFERFGFSKTSL